MRYRAWLPVLLLLAACSSDPPDSSKLTFTNSSWDRVNVEVVITRSADCDNRGEGYVSTQEFFILKDKMQTVVAPNGTSVCWRHDRNPSNPTPGVWSGWSRAVLFPGTDTKTEV